MPGWQQLETGLSEEEVNARGQPVWVVFGKQVQVLCAWVPISQTYQYTQVIIPSSIKEGHLKNVDHNTDLYNAIAISFLVRQTLLAPRFQVLQTETNICRPWMLGSPISIYQVDSFGCVLHTGKTEVKIVQGTGQEAVARNLSGLGG